MAPPLRLLLVAEDVDDLQRLLGETAIGRPLGLALLRLTERSELVVVPREA